jgi:hypothetical protein
LSVHTTLDIENGLEITYWQDSKAKADERGIVLFPKLWSIVSHVLSEHTFQVV